MGYCGLMGYGVQFPAHRGGGPKNVWDFGGYGLWQAWVMRVPTVQNSLLNKYSPKKCQRAKENPHPHGTTNSMTVSPTCHYYCVKDFRLAAIGER